MVININGLTYAYIGDAYYELKIRNFLIDKGIISVNKLHKLAVKYVSSNAQAKAIKYLIDNNILNEDEISYYKLGRNKSSTRNGIDGNIYRQATGFESLIGYLSLNDKLRCDELIDITINYLSEGI
ncbi:MAG: ribonuclease III domain-containing protein [Acholeplasmataceae bacterium]